MNKVLVKKAGRIAAEPETIMSCQNKSFSCSLPVEVGFQFCIKHILQDTKAPYKACNYMFSNGKQCGQAKLASVEESSDKK
jgi:hypothetical protein